MWSSWELVSLLLGGSITILAASCTDPSSVIREDGGWSCSTTEDCIDGWHCNANGECESGAGPADCIHGVCDDYIYIGMSGDILKGPGTGARTGYTLARDASCASPNRGPR